MQADQTDGQTTMAAPTRLGKQHVGHCGGREARAAATAAIAATAAAAAACAERQGNQSADAVQRGICELLERAGLQQLPQLLQGGQAHRCWLACSVLHTQLRATRKRLQRGEKSIRPGGARATLQLERLARRAPPPPTGQGLIETRRHPLHATPVLFVSVLTRGREPAQQARRPQGGARHGCRGGQKIG